MCTPFRWLAPARIKPAPGKTQRIGSELFFPTQRANVRYEGMNLILAERILEGRHSTFTIANDFSKLRIGQLLDCRRAKARNVHALSNLRATSVLTVTHRAFRPERGTAAGAY